MNTMTEGDVSGYAGYPWPKLPGRPEAPVWTGHGFRVGASSLPLLSYEIGVSGWTDDLTAFHEEEAGERHPIELASRGHALDELLKHVPAEQPKVLEVGCSSGYMLRDIKNALPDALVIGSDYVRAPLERLAHDFPSIPIMQFDLVTCPLADASLDAVVLLNVLEHIQEDQRALEQVWRVLKPGGVAVIEVPAGPGLYDVYDKLLMHCRRYRLGDLVAQCKSAGFEVVQASHLGFFLYPPFWFVKKKNRRLLSAEESVQRQAIASNIKTTRESRVMGAVMKLELAIGKAISYPVGIRCLATCIKPLGSAKTARALS